MKIEQPDLIGLENTDKPTNTIKAMEEAQTPESRRKAMRKRGAVRPEGERKRTAGKRGGSNWSNWSDTDGMGGTADIKIEEE